MRTREEISENMNTEIKTATSYLDALPDENTEELTVEEILVLISEVRDKYFNRDGLVFDMLFESARRAYAFGFSRGARSKAEI